MKQCRRCYEAFMQRWAENSRYTGMTLVEPEKIVFKCMLSMYDPSTRGDSMYRIYDCKQARYRVITPEQLIKWENGQEI